MFHKMMGQGHASLAQNLLERSNDVLANDIVTEYKQYLLNDGKAQKTLN
jgi:hypothetical protein